MEWLTNTALALGGIALLAAGGEALIRGALAVAKRLRVSPLLSGLVIVGFGTSMPELTVSLDAARIGNVDIAIGNVVGSNIGNILLILGICAAIAPLKVAPTALRRDALVVIASSLAFVAFGYGGQLTRIEGGIMLLLLLTYLAWTYWSDRNRAGPGAEVHAGEADAVHIVPQSKSLIALAIIGGLALLIGGAKLLIVGAGGLAESLGASPAVIGLTVVAVGTSLPELTVSVLAAVRGQGDVAVGNILGSNVFNVLGILGISTLVQPLTVAGRVAAFDQWVMLATSVLLFAMLATQRRLGRLEGGFLLLGYGAYLVYSFAGM